ncbi:hypothetical protein [Peteryoungia ipomoeae]|nr:hypothetical protein [Peteryoungia ipomoeae]
MLYILENRKTLAIAWNGYAPQPKHRACWEVLSPRRQTKPTKG